MQAIMERYGNELLRTAILLVKDRQAAEEAVQDTFLTGFHKIEQLHEPAKLKSWLTRILVNRCRMRLRSWHWRLIVPFAALESFAEDSFEPGPEDAYMLQSQQAGLTQAIHKLPYPYREAITLYYYNEMSVQEIADELMVNINTIKARLSRGRSRLKLILEGSAEQR